VLNRSNKLYRIGVLIFPGVSYHIIASCHLFCTL
jgi:hypothetical protein